MIRAIDSLTTSMEDRNNPLIVDGSETRPMTKSAVQREGGSLNEADHKVKLVKEVRLLGGYARRLEDKYALGLLDLIIKLPGRALLWGEGKLIEGHQFAPTPRQYEEGKSWIKAGANALLIGWQNKTMYISPWVEKADKRECYATSGISYAESLLLYLNEVPLAKSQDSGRA